MTGAERAVERRGGGPAAPAALPTLAAPVTLDERLAATDPVAVLPKQLLLAQERSAWLAQRLAEQVAREGVHGITGTSYTITVDGPAIEVGEFTRDLAAQERREREHVASLAERSARLGISDGAKARDSDVSDWMARALKAFAVELGLDLDDDEIERKAKRAFAKVWEQRLGRGFSASEARAYFGDGLPDVEAPTE